MAGASLRGKAAIVGAATFGIGVAPGYGAIDLAAKLALADAGLQHQWRIIVASGYRDPRVRCDAVSCKTAGTYKRNTSALWV